MCYLFLLQILNSCVSHGSYKHVKIFIINYNNDGFSNYALFVFFVSGCWGD